MTTNVDDLWLMVDLRLRAASRVVSDYIADTLCCPHTSFSGVWLDSPSDGRCVVEKKIREIWPEISANGNSHNVARFTRARRRPQPCSREVLTNARYSVCGRLNDETVQTRKTKEEQRAETFGHRGARATTTAGGGTVGTNRSLFGNADD